MRPRMTNRGCAACPNAISDAAVTPRAPPVTTNTAPDVIARAGAVTTQGTPANVMRSPAAERPTSVSGPPPNSSATIASATEASLRVARCTSSALHVAKGHSSRAVLASAATPPIHARTAPRPARPKSPPVSCTVMNRPPVSRNRCATARAARNASRFTAMAACSSATGRSPPRKITPPAVAGIAPTAASIACTPRATSRSTSAVATWPPSGVTTIDVLPESEGSAEPSGGAGRARTAIRRTGEETMTALPCSSSARAVPSGEAAAERTGKAAAGTLSSPFISSTICANVRMDAIFVVATCGRSGTC